MHVTDICSIFGNALDNAIEHVILIRIRKKTDPSDSIRSKGFVFIKIENIVKQKFPKMKKI